MVLRRLPDNFRDDKREGSMTSLRAEHLTMLTESAISIDVVAKRGYRSMGSRYDLPELEALGFTKAQARIPGLLIPLHGIDGEIRGYQYRPDSPREKDGKPIKYETPRGQKNILDIPSSIRNELRKGRQAILVTEGAKKADALASLGVPVINVPGVWSWRGKNADGGYTALADWEDVAIKGNRFVLAFDSDILTKPDVNQALSRLKGLLERRGADKVRVLLLPQVLSGKTGIDDYIAEKGITDKEELAKLVVDDLPSLNGHHKAEAIDVPPPGELLESVRAFIRRYVVLTPSQVDAVTLWVAHCHAFKAAETTPYLSVRSAEKRSGKSRLLEVLELLVPSPLKTENISVAALARSVDQGATLLLDEIDSVFGKGKASETQEMLRGILDSGYRTGGSYVRMAGQGASMEPRRFSTFSPKVISGIGGLPGTLEDRSIVIQMKRKLPGEHAERFRFRDGRDHAKPIRDRLAAWASSAIKELIDARPDISTQLDDRAADGWEPLLAIADMAGDDWPQQARDAALALSVGEAREDESLGVRLLADIAEAFGTSTQISTNDLLAVLNGMEESPWGGFRDGQGMTGRSLANMLRRYSVSPCVMRNGLITFRGYDQKDFIDAFSRYIPDSIRNKRYTSLPCDGEQESKCNKSHPVTLWDDPSSAPPSHVTFVTQESGGIGERAHKSMANFREDCDRCRNLHYTCSMHLAEAGLFNLESSGRDAND
jgi:hypothetical protein